MSRAWTRSKGYTRPRSPVSLRRRPDVGLDRSTACRSTLAPHAAWPASGGSPWHRWQASPLAIGTFARTWVISGLARRSHRIFDVVETAAAERPGRAAAAPARIEVRLVGDAGVAPTRVTSWPIRVAHRQARVQRAHAGQRSPDGPRLTTAPAPRLSSRFCRPRCERRVARSGRLPPGRLPPRRPDRPRSGLRASDRERAPRSGPRTWPLPQRLRRRSSSSSGDP